MKRIIRKIMLVCGALFCMGTIFSCDEYTTDGEYEKYTTLNSQINPPNPTLPYFGISSTYIQSNNLSVRYGYISNGDTLNFSIKLTTDSVISKIEYILDNEIIATSENSDVVQVFHIVKGLSIGTVEGKLKITTKYSNTYEKEHRVFTVLSEKPFISPLLYYHPDTMHNGQTYRIGMEAYISPSYITNNIIDGDEFAYHYVAIHITKTYTTDTILTDTLYNYPYIRTYTPYDVEEGKYRIGIAKNYSSITQFEYFDVFITN